MSNPTGSADEARPRGNHWIELGPIDPTPPGQVQVLNRWIYVGPTLADIYNHQRSERQSR